MFRLSCFLFMILSSVLKTVTSVDTYSRYDFPPGFVFGAATSAYQAEGAAFEDGRTASVWDTFTHQGHRNGATADVAVDAYHKYKEDVKLMAGMGLDAYRFSISWSRLIPNGKGPVNPKGLDYYNDLINQLISHGIQPHVTLFHFDLPQALEDEYGGWLSRKIVKDFTNFADVCFREFGDRVAYWTTLNDPNGFVIFAYDFGLIPPNRCSSPFGFNCTKGDSTTEPYLAAHHLLLSHASAARLYRKKYQAKQSGFIGISIFAAGSMPATNSTEDAAATQRYLDFFIGLIAHPVVYGDYPKAMKERAGSRIPVFTKHESNMVKNSCDFIGLIHYFTYTIKDTMNSLKAENRDMLSDMAAKLIFAFDNSSTGIQFPIVPEGLQGTLEYFKQAYGNTPIYILENGQQTPRNGSLEDTSRIRYIQQYIGAMLDAIWNGSNVRGYFVWSLLDVFEFIGGYYNGYGLYYVDLDDPELTRYPKLSAHWYSQFLKGEKVFLDSFISSFPIMPEGLQGMLEYFKQAYGNPPIYILENGQQTPRNGSLEDTCRVQYLQAYIGATLEAIRNGSNTRGYFVWSLFDLFEFFDGYGSGYGLYYVDLDDPELKIYPKLSAHWYSQFLKEGKVGFDGVIKPRNDSITSLSAQL